MDDIETKLSAARTRLILDKPFLGALVLRLPMIAANPNWCRTTATDARSFYYNADYINELSVEQTQFILAHEALHCALSHFARRHHRNKHRWDLACDFAINPLLIADGLTPVPEALHISAFDEMTAEEIYPCLDDKDDDSQTHDQHIYDEEESEGGQRGGGGQPKSDRNKGPGRGEQGNQGEQGGGGRPPEPQSGQGGGGRSEPDQSQDGQGSGGAGAGQPPPLSHEEREQLSVQWRQRMAGAAQQAMMAGKLSGPMARLVEHLLQPQLPWRMLLAHYMSATARDDYNYSRPSRRQGAFIMPSLRSSEIDVVVALDTSGSVSDEEMRQFLSEVDAIKGQLRAKVTLIACDASMAADGPWTFEPWEEFAMPREFRGGGGTDFRPVFDWLEQEGRQPHLVAYFTDGQGQFPKRPPSFPVLWLIKGRGKVPWGQRVQLN